MQRQYDVELNPHVIPVCDEEMRQRTRSGLNRLCDISDWRVGRFLEIVSEVISDYPFVHRKAWEYGLSIEGLEQLGCIKDDAVALAVGAGYERPLFWHANKIRRMVATDIYEGGDEGNPEMLVTPEKFALTEYRRDHLEVMQMNGCDLKFEDSTFDFVFTLSSIEHFGSRENIVKSMQEMSRVVKSGGIVCVITEYILNNATHHEYFTHEDLYRYLIDSTDLELVEPELDLTISESLLQHPIDLQVEKNIHVAPHIVLRDKGVLWTSLSLFFRKP